MSHKHDTWGWMLAVDFFFAGMGAAMLVIAGIADLFFDAGQTSLLGNILAPCFVALGAGLLILELGRPFQAWRVFMNFKAILTVGAWCMTLCIIFGFIYASFGIRVFPWSDWVALRKIVAIICLLVGLVVAIYPGILLGRHKSRPLWTGPGMMILFFLSSVITGAAAHLICSLLSSPIWVRFGILPPAEGTVMSAIPGLLAALLLIQLLFWFGYMWIKISGTTEREAKAARRWTSGNYAVAFKVGFMLFGTLIPLILFLFSGPIVYALGSLLAIIGGLIMRNLVVYSGQDRTWLPGEEEFRSRLPLGDERFMKVLK